MDVRRRFIIALLGIAASVVAGCTRDLDPGTMQTTGPGGAMRHGWRHDRAGGNTPAIDARAKVDSRVPVRRGRGAGVDGEHR